MKRLGVFLLPLAGILVHRRRSIVLFDSGPVMCFFWRFTPQLSIAIEAANKDSTASSTVLNLARSSTNIPPTPLHSVQSENRSDPAMNEVQECCPCWMKRCTCNCISAWKDSSGYRAWRSMRLQVKKVVEHRYFEWGILVIIIASSFTLVSGCVHLSMRACEDVCT